MVDETWYERPEDVPEDISAGGIVVRREEDRVYVALAREIEEEVGITDLTMVAPLGTKERLSLYRTAWKVTHYFLYITEQIEATPVDLERHDAMTWVPIDDLQKVFWPEQRDLIRDSIGAIQRAFG